MGILAKEPYVLRVKRERLAAGLKQSEAAKACGTTQAVVSEVENGRRHPWPALRAAMAGLYGVGEVELFKDMTWWEFKLPAQRLPRLPVFKPKAAE